MAEIQESEIRVAALCRRLGYLWSRKNITAVDNAITTEKAMEGKMTLIGQLHPKPKVNIQAFQNTMRKAWRAENVDISLLAPGVFGFRFFSEIDRDMALNMGPWSFANHLLLLKPWEPNAPPARYNFNTCTFWVQIHRLPIEWMSEEVVARVAGEIGDVSEVKIEA